MAACRGKVQRLTLGGRRNRALYRGLLIGLALVCLFYMVLALAMSGA
jgi:hypothetical protein